MSVNYEVREILNIGHQELGVTGVPGVTAGSQKNFGRRLCSRIDILAASARRNKGSMTVNYEVREILNIGHKELELKGSRSRDRFAEKFWKTTMFLKEDPGSSARRNRRSMTVNHEVREHT